MIACHESRTMTPDVCTHTFHVIVNLMHASFNGMFVSYALPENGNGKSNIFQTMLSRPKQLQRNNVCPLLYPERKPV